jgi:ABC-type histidine transport system ATPase subunit
MDGFAAESGQNDEYRTFSQKSVFIFCTTISTNPQGFRIKIDESETKMPEDRVGALSRSTWQPEIA